MGPERHEIVHEAGEFAGGGALVLAAGDGAGFTVGWGNGAAEFAPALRGGISGFPGFGQFAIVRQADAGGQGFVGLVGTLEAEEPAGGIDLDALAVAEVALGMKSQEQQIGLGPVKDIEKST